MSILANGVDWTKTDSKSLQQFVDDPKWAGQEFQKFLNQKRILRLKHLQLLNPNISISSEPFSKQEFLNSKLGIKIYMGDNFKNWIVSELLEEIPAFSVNLASYKLTKNMYDKEIRAEIGEDDVRTPNEALAIIFSNIAKQPNGEAGDFLNNGYANIQYVRLKNGEVVAVFAPWFSDDREWSLDACRLDGSGWREDNRVFARS